MSNLAAHRDMTPDIKPLEPQHVIDAFAAFSGIGTSILCGPERAEAIVWPRHELCWLLRHLSNLSWARIGSAIGGRDQATVRNSMNRVEARRAEDAAYSDRLDRARDFVTNYNPAPRGAVAIGRARKMLASHAAAQHAEVRDLAMVVLMTVSLLASKELSDAEARAAAIQIIGGDGDV